MGRRTKLVIGILLAIASVPVVLSTCDLMLGLMQEKTIDLPPAISGKIDWDQTGPTALTSAQVTTIADWVAQHRSGWGSDLSTRNGGVAVISLDTTARKGAVRLTLYPGPNGAMSIEYRADRDGAIKWFGSDELAAIREIVGIVSAPRNSP
jgi:hypothetical protein